MADLPPAEAGFALYVHWPFCTAKCPYCDFNSHVAAHVDQGRWAAAFEREIERAARETPDGILGSIFFGGGTPSLMEPETVARVLTAARQAWRWSNDCEITLEANPTSVEADRFDGYADIGVNRVSLGIQALRDDDLRRLGRLHTVAEAQAALAVAKERFDRVSFDLIYARQDQDVAAWRNELTEAIDLGTDHLSLYQLTIETGTAFGDRFAAGGLRGLPDEDRAADLWDVTQELTAKAGLVGYETSNHARDGAESRHNLVYWLGGDYVGVGPGAHGRLTIGGTRIATETELQPSRWLNAVERSGSGETSRTALTSQEAVEERIMMGLRLVDGVPFGDWLSGYECQINELAESGLVETQNNRLRLTARGRPLLNAVLRELLTG